VDALGKISDNTLLEYESVGTSCKGGFDIILIFQSAQQHSFSGRIHLFQPPGYPKNAIQHRHDDIHHNYIRF